MADAMLNKEKPIGKKGSVSKAELSKDMKSDKGGKKQDSKRKLSISASPNDDITLESNKTAAGSSTSCRNVNTSPRPSPPKTRSNEKTEPSLKDLMSVLVSIQSEQKAQKQDVNKLQTMVNDIYQDYDDDNYDDENAGEVDKHYTDDNNNNNLVEDQVIAEDSSIEPPSKRQKTTEPVPSTSSSSNDSVFKVATNNFKVKDSVDGKVNNDLADMVNSIFREGISDEKYADLMKEIHRPENCTSLTRTRVNQLIWDLLYPQTRSFDSVIQQHQTTIIKAACNVVKMLNIIQNLQAEHEDLDGIQECLNLGVDSLGLMGHYNKMTNTKRKENHRFDLLQDYSHLSSPNLAFTDELYGDDISKNVKEIQDVNRVGKRLTRFPNQNGRGRLRGGRGIRRSNRGRGGRGRGRGPRGRGRGMHNQNFDRVSKNYQNYNQ